MKNSIFIFSFCIGMLMLSGCGANADNASAEKTSDTFYQSLMNGNVDEALNYCSQSAFAAGDDRDAWKSAIVNNLGLLGKMQSYKKTSGWNIEKSTERGTQVTTSYEVVYESGKAIDSLTLVKDEDGVMRILNYRWDVKEARYLDAMKNAESIVSQYMENLKNKSYNTCYTLCGYIGAESSPEDKWVGMLATTSAQTGEMSSFEIDQTQTYSYIAAEGNAGKGNYYEVYAISNCGIGSVSEVFNLFQPSFNEPVKIISHDRKQL